MFLPNLILQFNPILLVGTPLGHGILIIDYGMHQNACRVVALERNGVVKHFDCNDVLPATKYHVNLAHNTNHG